VLSCPKPEQQSRFRNSASAIFRVLVGPDEKVRTTVVPEHLVPDTSALSIYFFWMIGYRRRVMISNQSILWLWFGLRYAFCVIFIDLSGTNRFKQSQKRAPPNLVGGSFLPSSLNIARVFRHRFFFIFFTALSLGDAVNIDGFSALNCVCLLDTKDGKRTPSLAQDQIPGTARASPIILDMCLPLYYQFPISGGWKKKSPTKTR